MSGIRKNRDFCGVSIPTRVHNILTNAGITKIADIRPLGRKFWMRQPNSGKWSVAEIEKLIGGWHGDDQMSSDLIGDIEKIGRMICDLERLRASEGFLPIKDEYERAITGLRAIREKLTEGQPI